MVSNSANNRPMPNEQPSGTVPFGSRSKNGWTSRRKEPSSDARQTHLVEPALGLASLVPPSSSRSTDQRRGFCFWHEGPNDEEGDQRHACYGRKSGRVAKIFGDQARRRSA